MNDSTRNALHALDIIADTFSAVHGNNVMAREETLNRLQRDKERKEDRDYRDKIRAEDLEIQQKRWDIEDKRYETTEERNIERIKVEDERFEDQKKYSRGRDALEDKRYEEDKKIRDENIEKEEIKYKNTLEQAYGPDNVIKGEDGLYRRKTEEEGWDIFKTPEYQIKEALDGITSEKDQKQIKLNALSNEFYDLKNKRDASAKDLREKYVALNDEFITREFTDLGDYITDMSNANIANIKEDIETLGADIKDLNQIREDMEAQAVWYAENVDSYKGVNTLLDPHEFSALVKDYMADMPGQLIAGDTSGLTQAYLDSKPTDHDRKKVTWDLKAEYDVNSQASYEQLQAIIGEIDDIDDEGEREELLNSLDTSPTVQLTMINAVEMAGFEDFLKWLDDEKIEALANNQTPMIEKFRAYHPQLMWSIETNKEKANSLMQEYNSVTDADILQVHNNFKAILSTISNEIYDSDNKITVQGKALIKQAFDEFQSAKSGFLHHDKENINKLFESIEKHFNIDDMEDAYMNYLEEKYGSLPGASVSVAPTQPGTYNPVAHSKQKASQTAYDLNQPIYAALGIATQGYDKEDVLDQASMHAHNALNHISRDEIDTYATDAGNITQGTIDRWFEDAQPSVDGNRTSDSSYYEFAEYMKAGFGLNEYHIEDLWAKLGDGWYDEKDLTPFIGEDLPKATGNIFLPGMNAEDIYYLSNPDKAPIKIY